MCLQLVGGCVASGGGWVGTSGCCVSIGMCI